MKILKTCFFSWSRSCFLSLFLGQDLVFFFSWSRFFSFFFSLSKACFPCFLSVLLNLTFWSKNLSFINSHLSMWSAMMQILIFRVGRRSRVILPHSLPTSLHSSSQLIQVSGIVCNFSLTPPVRLLIMCPISRSVCTERSSTGLNLMFHCTALSQRRKPRKDIHMSLGIYV